TAARTVCHFCCLCKHSPTNRVSRRLPLKLALEPFGRRSRTLVSTAKTTTGDKFPSDLTCPQIAAPRHPHCRAPNPIEKLRRVDSNFCSRKFIKWCTQKF